MAIAITAVFLLLVVHFCRWLTSDPSDGDEFYWGRNPDYGSPNPNIAPDDSDE